MIGDSESIHSMAISTVANSVFDFNPPPAEPQDLLFKTRAMRKRKATESGLRGVELVGALHTLIELRNVLLRERRQGEEGRGWRRDGQRRSRSRRGWRGTYNGIGFREVGRPSLRVGGEGGRVPRE